MLGELSIGQSCGVAVKKWWQMKVFLNKNPSESKHAFRRETLSLEKHTKISRTIFQTSKNISALLKFHIMHGLHVCPLLGVLVKDKSETYIRIKTQIPTIVYRHIPGNASIFCGALSEVIVLKVKWPPTRWYKGHMESLDAFDIHQDPSFNKVCCPKKKRLLFTHSYQPYPPPFQRTRHKKYGV